MKQVLKPFASIQSLTARATNSGPLSDRMNSGAPRSRTSRSRSLRTSSAVIERAKVVLEALESGEREGGNRQKALIDDLPLFSAAAMAPRPAPVKPATSPVEDRLRALTPDDLSPRDALDLIYALKAMVRDAP